MGTQEGGGGMWLLEGRVSVSHTLSTLALAILRNSTIGRIVSCTQFTIRLTTIDLIVGCLIVAIQISS